MTPPLQVFREWIADVDRPQRVEVAARAERRGAADPDGHEQSERDEEEQPDQDSASVPAMLDPLAAPLPAAGGDPGVGSRGGASRPAGRRRHA